MKSDYINIYNKLISLTRNKELYRNFEYQDKFSDRLIFFLFHFAFFLKVFKNDNSKDNMQKIYDFMFRQLELNIREIGYGDQSINKKMKDYLNIFHEIIDKIHFWEDLSVDLRTSLLLDYLGKSIDASYLADYFEKYRLELSNNTLNFYLKGVLK
ncbi:ubiquinol-cytochrome C chaperone family protein [Candidatus Pelagibacter sp. Uisw_099_02]|uniref:ubiquinol-cytochrome C chaperone family protein n=1 Tax=Candidatus Pelagibacter sp. Uisw_099_02 TaxID=3230981 RepID=UPI0039ED6363|tara:strand:+ start:112 stop:576 length:465 start_codon:yes stop_codon:yes gene_type:complete